MENIIGSVIDYMAFPTVQTVQSERISRHNYGRRVLQPTSSLHHEPELAPGLRPRGRARDKRDGLLEDLELRVEA